MHRYQGYCSLCHGDVAVIGGVLPDLRYSGTLDNNLCCGLELRINLWPNKDQRK